MAARPISIAVCLALAGSLLACTSACTRPVKEAEAPVVETWTAYLEGKPVQIPKGTLGDEATIAKIIDEGKNRNQVMDHLRYLTQEIGPRLTGSKRALRANQWFSEQYTKWGLSNPHLEQWGTIGVGFNRGPSTGKLLMAEAAPRRRPGAGGDGAAAPAAEQPKAVRDMQITTLSWSRGTNGPVRGKVVRMPRDEAEFEKVADQLKGAWVLMPAPQVRGMRDIRGRIADQYEQRKEARAKVAEGTPKDKLSIFERVSTADVAGFISNSRDERVWTGSISGWRTLSMETLPPEVHVQVRLSDYDYLNSRLTDGETVWAEFDIQAEFQPGPVPVYNTIAEIPGSTWPEQVVIVSGHADSWDGPGSQGATDNGTGTAVTLEAARILMAAGAKPKRTIRFIHWTGEEQGLLGSRGYVAKHEAEWPNWSACFVDDGGTNSQGGLGASTDEMANMLAAATAPTNGLFFDSADNKALNVNVRKVKTLRDGTGGSDHASFIAKGIPAFFWDETGRADYGYGWHTQNDKLDLAVPEYLMQSATNSAITAYRLACADTLLPREPKAAAPAGDEQPRRSRPPTQGANPPASAPSPSAAPDVPVPAKPISR